MYGDQNASLTYLPTLTAAGAGLAPIPRSGHFPMYANAPAMWDAITAFLRQPNWTHPHEFPKELLGNPAHSWLRV